MSVNETNSLVEPRSYHETVTRNLSGCVDWKTPGLKILRLRLLSDPGFPYWDVSYCHGQLPDGTYVNVGLPFMQLEKRRPINRQLVDWAKKEGVFLKPTGIFSAVSTLN